MQTENEEKEHLIQALRVVQLTFINIAQDQTIYPKIRDAWKHVSIALAKEAA
jgi:hypothetical protein